MTQRVTGSLNPRTDHICNGRTCMYCRVLNNPDRPRLTGNNPTMDPRISKRIKEPEHKVLMANVQTELELGSKIEEIERLALLDSLTELYNSRHFMKALDEEIRRAKRYKRPLSICILAVDDLLEIQAEYGTLLGDLVLKVVAGLLHMTVRDVDVPARYSCTELAAIFPETNLASAGVAAERIRQKIINQPISNNWQNFNVTASFGIAAFPTHGNDAKELVNECLQGLAHSKERGRGYICSP